MRIPHLSAGLVKEGQLTKRLQAWWQGYYFEAEPEPEPEVEAPKVSEDLDSGTLGRDSAAWSDPRVQVTEKVWGTGYMSPGGDVQVQDLIKPLGLDSSMMIVDIGAGLGGTTRALHGETGAWVSGFEVSPLLSDAAMELSRIAGLTRKATVETFETENLPLRENGYNAVFSKEALFTMDNKEAVFQSIYNCLRVDGQLLITDYLATKPEATGGTIDEWVEQEPIRPNLWSLEQTRSFIADLGFEVRITEDITPALRGQILRGLGAFTSELDPKVKKPRGWNPAILAEVEMWANRVKVLESGDVAAFRIYGRKFDPSLK
ncbi:MAG: methyltransferase domain-containing protein [Rhodospirillaceae bacterium]|jgi:SAM-dependent methyltransferase|nr:methyltransferase domain-containing protein [Rhodospirillaceae bacterium]